ncbi:MAG: DUF5693 family protein [Bacillota bacterium]
MSAKTYQRLLILMVAAALVPAFWLAGQRVGAERDFRQVEMAVVYEEAVLLAGLLGREPAAVLEDLREQGVTAVLFREPTLNQAALAGEFTVLSAAELRDKPWFAGAGFELFSDHQYLVTRDERVFERLGRQMEMKVPSSWSYVTADGSFVVAAPIPGLYLDVLGAGFPAHGLEQAAAAGLDVIPQVRTWPGVTPTGLTLLAETLTEMPGLSAVAFNDPTLPGYPGLVHVLARELGPLGVPVTDVEFFPQAGVKQLGRTMPARQVMLHAIPAHEMARYTPAQAADRFVLAAVERNARVLLVRFFFDASHAGDVWAANSAYLKDITSRLEAAGLTLGTPKTPVPWQPPRVPVVLIGLGVVAGGLLLWEMLRNSRLPGPALALPAAAAAAWLAVAFITEVNWAAKLAALAGVIIFPSLALVSVVREEGASVGASLVRFLQAAAISLVGAVYMVGLLSDTGFLIKLDQFAGVKLAHAAPLLLVIPYLAFRPRDGAGWLERFRDFLDRPVLVKYAAVAAVVAAVGAVYLLRTGNEPALLVSSIELKLRSALDQLLAVRPRTKEFLLGHPWLLLLLFTGCRDARFLPLAALGLVGQISLVNTFAHLHTPLFVSAFRAFNGLWLGVALGLALIAAWYLGGRMLEAGSRRSEAGGEEGAGGGQSGVER